MTRFPRCSWLAALLPVLALSIVGARASAGYSAQDRETERFLRDANVVQIRELISSTTSLMALDLELAGEERVVAFKYKDGPRPRHLYPAGKLDEVHPPHGYLYEVAAYHLDRRLGLGMVPVAVLRVVKKEGVAIEWLHGLSDLNQLRERGESPNDPERLARQQAQMRVFDALIFNRDRSESDQLIDPATSKLHLIDHGQAFGNSTQLPESFTSEPASLPRSLLANLEALQEKSLLKLLDGLLSEAEIGWLLERRDAILLKIAEDRKLHGDAKVFQD